MFWRLIKSFVEMFTEIGGVEFCWPWELVDFHCPPKKTTTVAPTTAVETSTIVISTDSSSTNAHTTPIEPYSSTTESVESTTENISTPTDISSSEAAATTANANPTTTEDPEKRANESMLVLQIVGAIAVIAIIFGAAYAALVWHRNQHYERLPDSAWDWACLMDVFALSKYNQSSSVLLAYSWNFNQIP